MKSNSKEFTTIDQYISSFPQDVQKILEKIRKVIKEIAPDATEKISYKMPTFELNNTYLVYFGAFKNHIGLYPATTANLSDALLKHKTATGTFQFKLDDPIPYELIKEFVEFRLSEILTK